MSSKKLKDAGNVFVVSVNDPFVMKAWQQSLDPDKKSGVRIQTLNLTEFSNILQIRFLGDPLAEFTNALDLAFDATAIFGQPRSKRYAIVVEDGKVKEAYVEPDNTGVNGTISFPQPEKSYANIPRSLRSR